MTLEIIKGDITNIEVDCIVNAANKTLLGGGGVDGAIHKKAGEKLLEECKSLNGCETSEAKITKGYNLKSKYVIHTVGPIYNDGKHNEETFLRNSYKNSLKLATNYDIKSIAFPLISAGVYGYPREDAVDVAITEIFKFLKANNDKFKVYLVIYRDQELLNYALEKLDYLEGIN